MAASIALLLLLFAPMYVPVVRREWQIRRARQALQSTRGLERWRTVIDAAIEALYAEYGADTFNGEQLPVSAVPTGVTVQEQIQAQLRLLAQRWQVTPPLIDVLPVAQDYRRRAAGWFMSAPATWSFVVDTAGTPRPDERAAWRIALSPDYFRDPLAISVILAHEFAHGVLGRDTLQSDSEEILTDVAAALLGWGEQMYALQTRIRRGYAGGRLIFTVGGPGYLDAVSLAYVLARQRSVLQAQQLPSLAS